MKTEVKREAEESPKKSPKKRVKKEEPPEERWEWWNEDPAEKEKREASGIKWTSLEHKGPLFPPEYTPLPKGVYMTYKGNKVKLEPEAEEVMTFYASMINTDYVTGKVLMFFTLILGKKSARSFFTFIVIYGGTPYDCNNFYERDHIRLQSKSL